MEAPNFYDGANRNVVKAIRKGCLPTITTASACQGGAFEVDEETLETKRAGKILFYSGSAYSSNLPTTKGSSFSVAQVKPLCALFKPGKYEFYRTNGSLGISGNGYNITFYPEDFREGVVPEYIYIVLQGAGGSGAGRTGGGGGGAGG